MYLYIYILLFIYYIFPVAGFFPAGLVFLAVVLILLGKFELGYPASVGLYVQCLCLCPQPMLPRTENVESTMELNIEVQAYYCYFSWVVVCMASVAFPATLAGEVRGSSHRSSTLKFKLDCCFGWLMMSVSWEQHK